LISKSIIFKAVNVESFKDFKERHIKTNGSHKLPYEIVINIIYSLSKQILYLLKNAINERKKRNMKQLKLIIMSATINEDIFENYYKDYKFVWMELAGTPNHPIKSIYLESGLDIKSNEYLEKGKEFIGQIVVNINKGNKEYIEGDILFFVCTVSECNNLAEELSLIYSDCFVMGLYSGFDTELEKYISSPDKFKELNPKFKRRIFISTNVAESSLTIDGIVYVIDSGLELSVKFNPKCNTNNMTKNFITQAQMIQRKGRAGRTKPGVCFHLYTPQEQSNTLKYPEPEIKCIDLKNTCISMMKICGDLKTYHNKRKKRKNKDEKNKDKNENNSIKTFCEVEKTIDMFLEFIEPPEKQFIINGFDFAYSNNLIGKDNKLTVIGQLVLETKLDVMDGLALLWAWNVSLSVFKDVFKIICVCSYLKSGINDLFYSDVDLTIKNKLLSNLLKKCDNSEHVLLLNLFNYINDNKDTGMFNVELYDNINNIYSRQINKLEYLYNRYNIKLEEVSIKKDLEKNIINSFGFGYKSNRAFKKIKGFMYNDKIVNLSKCVVKFKSNINSIIFYSNLNWSGKLNVMICSPYLS
jgi:pre-mRNA-splicing factor ATP-dependent RNA helicase DHX15/PRP43